MSTKIYSGYLLNEDIDVFDLQALYRKSCLEVAKDMTMCDLLDKSITHYYLSYLVSLDNASYSFLDGEKYKETSFREALRAVQIDTLTSKAEEDEKYKLQAYLRIMKHPIDKRIYLIFEGYPDYESKFIEQYPQVCTYYGYWNNTDPLDGVTNEEWKKRGKDWDTLIDLWKATSVQSLTAQGVTSVDSDLNLISLGKEDFSKILEDHPELMNKDEIRVRVAQKLATLTPLKNKDPKLTIPDIISHIQMYSKIYLRQLPELPVLDI